MFLFQGWGTPAQRPAAADVLRGLIGGSLSVYMLLALTEYSGHMWIMAPFGASCVLLYAAPQSPLAQPRNIF
jgi:CBS-domain-containing membrane protein